MAPVTYPPLELQADRAALTAISDPSSVNFFPTKQRLLSGSVLM